MVDAVAFSYTDWTDVPFYRERKLIRIQGRMVNLTKGIDDKTEKGIDDLTTDKIREEDLKNQIHEKDFREATKSGTSLSDELKRGVEMKVTELTPRRILLFLITSSICLGIGLMVFILSVFGNLHLLTGLIGVASGLGLFMVSILAYKEWRRDLV